MRIAASVALGVAAALGLAACGSEAEQKAAVPTTTDNTHQKKSLVRPGSAGRTVISFWENAKLGAVPIAVLAYAPEVRQAVGVQELAGTLAAQQGNIANTTPVVRQVKQTRLGPLVVMRAVRKEGTSPDYAFLLRRRRDTWVVTYDSFTAQALRSYVASRTRSEGGDKKQDAERSGEAGEAAAERFRSASLRNPTPSGR